MPAAQPNAPTTFKAAFELLQKNAETLRSQEEPDIDNLVNLVNGSLQAYAVCKERLDSVEEALKGVFAKQAEKSGTPPQAPKGARVKGGEPEIPF